jgi:hypothetical protein
MDGTNQVTDFDLITSYSNGNDRAFETLLNRYQVFICLSKIQH